MSQLADRVRALRVRDYMTPNPITLSPDDRLLDAELRVRQAGVRHIPVMNEGRLVGLLTERDIRRYAPSILDSTPEEYNRIFEQTLVGMVMSKDIATIGPDVPLANAVSQVYGQHRGCLPVMDNGVLVGILTRRDIVRFANDVMSGAFSEATA